MQELKCDQVDEVSGGFHHYIVGWAIGESINYGLSSLRSHAHSFSKRDHSQSNRHFLTNRGNFNPLI
jgi:hypothetical protein